MLLGDADGIAKAEGRGLPAIIKHQDIEAYLGRYAGLMLYLKEMDETIYAKLCAVCDGLENIESCYAERSEI
jgi:hypothetical protein